MFLLKITVSMSLPDYFFITVTLNSEDMGIMEIF